MFGRDPRAKAVLERALQQAERVLREMQKEGKDLTQLKIKRYQKTHYSNCTCSQCLEAKRTHDPHKRGLLEAGYKLYVGPGEDDEAE